MQKIITRKDALDAGFKRYFTLKPCKRGHVSERKASDRSCVECNRVNISNRRKCAEFVAVERARDRTKWAQCLDRRSAKSRADKTRRSSPEFLEKQRKRDREKYNDNPTHRKKKIASACSYSKKSRDKINKRNRERFSEKYRSDLDFRVAHNVRGMLARVIRIAKLSKTESTTKVLGYSFEEFKRHIERQFLNGMHWGNHGEWHIDHIVPVSLHLQNGETNPKVINALSNLRPIWASDNMSKGASCEVMI